MMEINKNQLDIYRHLQCKATNEENTDSDLYVNRFIEIYKTMVNEYIKEENDDNA